MKTTKDFIRKHPVDNQTQIRLKRVKIPLFPHIRTKKNARQNRKKKPSPWFNPKA
jgi:hypothetical protein